MTPNAALRLNALGLLAICLVLGFAFADQLLNDDLPCPLCLLQRAGMVAAGYGIALNLCKGLRPSHYGLTILGAVVGGAVALRQVALHVVPGSGAYGDPFLGLHFYSWAFIVFSLMAAGCGVMLVFDRQFGPGPLPDKPTSRFAASAYLLFFLLTLANGFSTVIECGGGMCPENPTSYQLLP